MYSVEKPVAIALEIRSGSNETRFVPHEIFDTKQFETPSDVTASAHNQNIEKEWEKICSSDDIATWLNNVCLLSFDAIRPMIGRGGKY